MPRSQPAPTTACQHRMYGQQAPVLKNADLVRQRVDFHHPAGGGIWHAVGIAIDADHAVTADAPFHAQYGIERHLRHGLERRVLFGRDRICAVVAASLNETYARNALNNGLLVMESPELFRALRERWPDGPTVRTGIQAELDFCEGVVRALGTRFPMNPLGRVGQELLLAGGLEEWVRRRMPREASREQPLRS